MKVFDEGWEINVAVCLSWDSLGALGDRTARFLFLGGGQGITRGWPSSSKQLRIGACSRAESAAAGGLPRLI